MRTGIALLALLAGLSAPAGAMDTLRLENRQLRLEVTPSFGGRVLGFSLRDRPNLLKVGEAVARQPHPVVDAAADDIAYLGHDVWLGPQSGWWTDQQANPARREAKANWPPDPYLAFARMRIVEQSPERVVMEGVDSPVTGVRLRKTFQLSSAQADTIEVHVEAVNHRDRPIRRDLWFNTRTPSFTTVYVPVRDAADVRVESTPGDGLAPLRTRVEHGLLSLDRPPLPEGFHARRGKVFVQPDAGWIAGFAQGQLFLIRFPLQARERIHPEHGQVELYHDDTRDPGQGLLELEVHAPDRTLGPGERMHATERWTAMPYAGADTPAAHRDFLCGDASRRLGEALCADRP